MSIRIMSAVWDSKRYDASTLVVLLAMADYANDEDNTCRPSIGRLADKSRLSQRQVMRILGKLKSDGTITPVGEFPTRTGSPIVIYRINLEALKGDTMSPLPTPKGDIGDTLKGDIQGMERVSPMSYDPLLGPSLEPSVVGTAPAPSPAAAPTEPEASAPVQTLPTAPEAPVAASWWEAPAPALTPNLKNLAQQPPVALYRDVFLRYPSKPQMTLLMAHGITDLRRWSATLQHWCGRGWSPTNIAGMLDLYDHPERLQERTVAPAAASRPAAAVLHPAAMTRTADGFDDWLAELSRTDNAHLHGAA